VVFWFFVFGFVFFFLLYLVLGGMEGKYDKEFWISSSVVLFKNNEMSQTFLIKGRSGGKKRDQ